MRSRVLIAGQAVHPLYIAVPLALLAVVVVFDVLYLITGQVGLASTAGHLIAAGVLLGAAVAAGEWLEWWFVVPEGHPARSAGLRHVVVDIAFLVLFAVSGLLRASQTDWVPGPAALATAWAGLLVGGVTVWLGARLGVNGGSPKAAA